MPPKDWDDDELRAVGAIDRSPVRASNLENEIHPLLVQERWSISDDEYEVLRPSLRLASRWIIVGMPWIATFLPSEELHEGLEACEDELEIRLKEQPVSAADLKKATEELDDITKLTKWELEYDILGRMGWLGITRLAPAEKPWRVLSDLQVLDSDERVQNDGHDRRPLIVGLMGEYVAALQKYDQTSENYLRAAFMAAYTITHEVGHVVFHQDFRSFGEDGSEPYVGDEHWGELGFSFMGWLFTKYNPTWTDLSDINSFKRPLCWEEHLSGTPRTPYKENFAIPTSYLQDMFTESFWTGIGDPSDSKYSDKAREALKPKPNSATAKIPEYSVDDRNRPTWIQRNQDRGEELNLASILTREEIQLVRKMTKDRQNRSGYLPCDDGDDDDDGADSKGGLGGGPKDDDDWDLGLTDDEEDFRKEEDGGTEGSSKKGTTTETVDINSDDEAKYGGSLDSDSDDDDFGPPGGGASEITSQQRTTSQRRPAEKFQTEVDDGHLAHDIELMDDPPEPEPIRIEIRYRPNPLLALAAQVEVANDPFASKKRQKVLDDKDEDSAAKRVRSLGPHIVDFKADQELIERLSVANFERKFTHAHAYAFCIRHDIPTRSYSKDVGWQNSNLSYMDPEDREVIDDMRERAFARSLFVGVEEIMLERKKMIEVMKLLCQALEELPSWTRKQIVKACKENGLPLEAKPSLSDEELTQRLAFWLRSQIAIHKNNFKLLLEEWGLPTNNLDYFWPIMWSENPGDHVEKWSTKDFKTYFTTHNLPTTGDLSCWRERVLRYREELRTGRPVSFDWGKINARTDYDGYELYVFKGDLYRSTFAAIRNKLYIVGNFRPRDVLTLYFADNKEHPLRDNEPLSDYPKANWDELIVEVALPKTFPRPPRKVTFRQRDLKSGATKTPGIPLESEGLPLKTVSELIVSIESTVVKIHEATLVGGGTDPLRPNVKPRKSKNGWEILDNLDEFQELKAEAEALMTVAEYAAGVADDEETTALFDDAHFAFAEIKRLEREWRDRDGDVGDESESEDEDEGGEDQGLVGEDIRLNKIGKKVAV